MSSNVTMREMLEAGVHFGHQVRYWHPKMEPYIFGKRNRIHIINLEKSLPMFREALNFIGQLVLSRKNILFVGTKRSAYTPIAEEAIRCGMPYIHQRWLGGFLTNFKTVKKSIARLKELEAMQTDNIFQRMSKKEALRHVRELGKLNKNLSGIKDMQAIPAALFIIDVGYEKIALKEANKLGLPVIGVVDSNHDPKGVDFVIPGNDDAVRAIRLYARCVADTILEANATLTDMSVGGEDEFVELDKSGAPILKDPGVTIKRRSNKNTVVQAIDGNDEAKEVPSIAESLPSSVEETKAVGVEDEPDDVKRASSKTTKKKLTKKKVTKKKVSTKKVAKKKAVNKTTDV